MIEDRDEIVRLARSWLGTPYVHGASTWGCGVDCLGLIRGIWRARYGQEPAPLPPYTPDWAEASREERLWQAARRYLDEIPRDQVRSGDILLFRMRATAPAKHLGILASDAKGRRSVIHAYSGVGAVESPLGDAWWRRVVAAFRFRGDQG